MREQGGDPFAQSRVPAGDLADLYQGVVDTPLPTARELGRRFRKLREEIGLSVDDVARRTLVSGVAIEDFEDAGAAVAETLLTLIDAMSAERDLDRAFLTPKFDDIDKLVEWGRRRPA